MTDKDHERMYLHAARAVRDRYDGMSGDKRLPGYQRYWNMIDDAIVRARGGTPVKRTRLRLM